MQDESDPPNHLNGRERVSDGSVSASEDGPDASGGSEKPSRTRSVLDGVLDAIRSLFSTRASTVEGDRPASASDPGGGPGGSRDGGVRPLVDVDPELLDAKRRIVQLLVVSGGSLPQSELVERTRWTSSTISRKLCEMESNDVVIRYTTGAGKTVVLNDDGR